VIIICSALIADAAIGNYQEKIMKEHHVPNVEIVFYSFMFGFGFVLLGLLVTNNFFSSVEFWNKVCLFFFIFLNINFNHFKHPFQTYGYGLIFSIFGYLGIDIVLTLIKEYGALICVTVTTCRKAITIILSFTLFSKPFVFEYVKQFDRFYLLTFCFKVMFGPA
jgi:adenosine 3'-phospho 5'-phosphosulfate transporter B3